MAIKEVKKIKKISSVIMKNIDIPSINAQSDNNIDTEIAQEFLKNINISTPVFSLIRGVTSRLIKVRARHPEDEEILKEIELRQGKIKNLNDFLNRLSLAPFYGYVIHEKIYNDDFSLNKLEFIPYKLIKYDKKKGLLLKGKDKEIPITEDKFLISVFDKTIDKPLGTSLFEWGLKEVYDDLKDVQSKVRGLQKKYGGIVPILGYYKEELDSLEGITQKKEFLKEKAKQYKEIVGGENILMVPISDGVPLKEQISYISLSDLKIDMHNILMKKYEEKIEKFIKGSTFSESKEGSQAKDRVQQNEKEKMEDSIAKFISSELQTLIEDDAQLFGYSPECFYIVFELDKGELENEAVELARVQTKREKVGLYTDIKNLGYDIKLEKLAEIVGIEPSDLIIAQGPEFNDNKKKDLLVKKLNFSRSLREKYENNLDNFSLDFTKDIKEFNLKDLEIIPLNFDFLHRFIIGILIGYVNSAKKYFEFSEEDINPFDLKFEEAIKFLADKAPILYEKLDEITEKATSMHFWIKKSTSLEVTNKIHKSILKSLENGSTYKEWYEGLDAELINLGLANNGYYAELVYRNNMATAYSVGSYLERQDNIENQPYGLYDSVMDDNTSDICKKLNGKVYKLSDPIWNKITPPNHHKCRSGVIAISKEEAIEMGVVIEKPTKEIKNLDLGTFNGNPGKSYEKTLKQSVSKKEKLYEELKVQLSLFEL